MTVIAVKSLRVTFPVEEGVIQAVQEVSFRVAEGEAFGLVGESGCGKSTILRCLCGLNTLWAGEILLGGARVGHRRDRAQYRLTQMVFQDPYGSLHPRHTVNTTLQEPLRIHGLDDADDRIRRILVDVGLGLAFRFRYPNQLSGGQRQRVAIARALILEPRILLLDEPTSALDVSVQAEILNLLSDLREQRGLTFVLVSHDLSVIAHMCDRLAVMDSGAIVEEMTVEELRRNRPTHPLTRRLLAASEGYDRRLVGGWAAAPGAPNGEGEDAVRPLAPPANREPADGGRDPA